MLAWALRALGADPAFFVGGEVPGLGPDGGTANAGWGEGEWVVAEADESDASFLAPAPEIAVVTNVEMDHHSRWGSLAELHEAFRAFAEPARGLVRPADEEMGWLDGVGGETLAFDGSSPGPADLGLAGPRRAQPAQRPRRPRRPAAGRVRRRRGGRGPRRLPRRPPAPGAEGGARPGPYI